jgi:hypothetical protein
MSGKFCQSLHNVAFATTDCIDRTAIFYAFVGFLVGLALGLISCNSML